MFHSIFGCFQYKKWLPKKHKNLGIPDPPPLYVGNFSKLYLFFQCFPKCKIFFAHTLLADSHIQNFPWSYFSRSLSLFWVKPYSGPTGCLTISDKRGEIACKVHWPTAHLRSLSLLKTPRGSSNLELDFEDFLNLKIHQRWRQHCAINCPHCLHCLYHSNCFTLLKQQHVCLCILLGKVRTRAGHVVADLLIFSIGMIYFRWYRWFLMSRRFRICMAKGGRQSLRLKMLTLFTLLTMHTCKKCLHCLHC